MKKTTALLLSFILSLSFCCIGYSESILPALSTSEADGTAASEVVMPSLQQVSWYEPASVTKEEDNRIVYTFNSVSENAYQKLGEALAQVGYELKENSTDENGYMHFLVGDDENEMELVYHEVGGTMDVKYPENAVLAERDEEALTTHLQFEEPFETTDESVYSLVDAKAVSGFRYIYAAGYPMSFRYDEHRESEERRQIVMLCYTCENTVVYEIESTEYFGDLEFDEEAVSVSGYASGVSNSDYTLINELDESNISGNSTRCYARCVTFDPTACELPVSFDVVIYSRDNLMKYVYSVTIEELVMP